jgi:hypothetical protein
MNLLISFDSGKLSAHLPSLKGEIAIQKGGPELRALHSNLFLVYPRKSATAQSVSR